MRYSRNRNRCDNCTELEGQIEYANKLLEYFMLRDRKPVLARGTEDFPRPPRIPLGSIVLGKRPRLDRLEIEIIPDVKRLQSS